MAATATILLSVVVAAYFAAALAWAPAVLMHKTTLFSFAMMLLTWYPFAASSDSDDPRRDSGVLRDRKRVGAWLMFLLLAHTLLFFLYVNDPDMALVLDPHAPPLRVYLSSVHATILAVLYAEFAILVLFAESQQDMAVFSDHITGIALPLAFFQACLFFYATSASTVSAVFYAIENAKKRELRVGAGSMVALFFLSGAALSLVSFYVSFLVHLTKLRPRRIIIRSG